MNIFEKLIILVRKCDCSKDESDQPSLNFEINIKDLEMPEGAKISISN